MSAKRVSATRRIAAPSAAIFAIVSSPAGHIEIDGSGMLVSSDAAAPTNVGDTFAMHMDRTPLSDIPNLVEYDVVNVVTQFEPNRLFEWGVGAPGGGTLGHVYGWQLVAVTETETDVTNYCDWTDLPEKYLARWSWPIVPVEMLERSVTNLEQIAIKNA
jgi:hypothetical protein